MSAFARQRFSLIRLISEHKNRFLDNLLLLTSFYFIWSFLVTAFVKISYPAEQDWIEGIMLSQAHRVMQGRDLYVEANLSYTPIIYPPLYPWLVGKLMQLFGSSYVVGRLVSIFASLGIFYFTAKFVKRESHSWAAGFLAAGIFAASYFRNGFWLDMARIDPLFVFFLLGGVYFLGPSANKNKHLYSIVLFLLAAMTKQTAIPVIIALCLYESWHRRWAGLKYSILLLSAVASFYLLLHLLTSGWSTFYIFEVPSKHHLLPWVFVGYLRGNLLEPFGIGILLTLALFASRFNQINEVVNNKFFLFVIFIIFSAVSFLGLAKIGGNTNNLLPIIALISVASAIFCFQNKTKWMPKIAILYMFSYFVYPPANSWRFLPKRDDLEAIHSKIRNTGGEIFAPGDSYWMDILQKPSSAHWSAMSDLFIYRYKMNIQDSLKDELIEAIQNRRFSMLILFEHGFFQDHYFPKDELKKHYQLEETIASRLIYVPKSFSQTKVQSLAR